MCPAKLLLLTLTQYNLWRPLIFCLGVRLKHMVVMARARQSLQLGGQVAGGGCRSAAAGTKA